MVDKKLTLKVEGYQCNDQCRVSVAKTPQRHANLKRHHLLQSVLEKNTFIFTQGIGVNHICVYQAHQHLVAHSSFQISYIAKAVRK